MDLTRRCNGDTGFALIVALSLMVLAGVVTVGLLSLATIALHSSKNEFAAAGARANARMALMLAIGELQKHAGPDQRVTATADLTGTIHNPHWLGVWKTTRTSDTSEIPVIRWLSSADDSSVRDDRSEGKVTRKDLFQSWLVSGEDTPDAPDAPGRHRTRIMGPGSTTQAADEVNVPLVTIHRSAANGAYAYWISDPSLKATAANLNQAANTTPAMNLTQPDRYGIATLAGLEGFGKLSDKQLAKVIDCREAELAGAGTRADWNRWRHATSARSLSVLCDTLRGGLKKDLTVFLLEGKVPAAGDSDPAVTDASPMLPATLRAAQGPKFGTLRAWTALAKRRAGAAVMPAAGDPLLGMDKFLSAPDQNRFLGQPVHPVLASAQLYTRFTYIRGYLAVHLYPRIILWNPYNTYLTAVDYTVDFNQSLQDSMTVEKADGTRIVDTAYDTRAIALKENRMRLNIEPTTFGPGEALVFTPKPMESALAGRAMPLVLRSSPGQNVMSAQVSPRQLTNFYLTLSELPGITAADLPVNANHNKGAYYWIDMMDWWEGNPDNGLKVSLHLGAANSYGDLMRLPLLQLVDTDNWKRGYEGRFNNGRWKVGGVEPVYNYETTSDFEPWPRTNYGFRYKWWAEKNPSNLAGAGADRFWQAAVTSDFNLRAAYCYRSPYDNITDNGEAHHWYMWGPYALEREQGLPYLSPELAAHSSPDGYRANPFFGGSNTRPAHVYPTYDLPAPDERVVSLGRFQHVQLTPFLWHTAYPVGGGYVPPDLKSRDRSADPPAQVAGQWSREMPWLPGWLAQKRGSDQVVYDLAYEVNHELWDRYFLSGSPAGEKARFLAMPDTCPLGNRRLQPVAGATAAALQDYHRAAAAVLLAGGFNVNSTSVGAWRALLASLRDLDLAGSSKGTPYPRCYNHAGAACEPASPYDPEVWTGTRHLSDAQIESLATRIVEEVKTRGPFVSVADFVNRRLVPATGPAAATGLSGTLQAAIDGSGLNNQLARSETQLVKSGIGNHAYEPGNNIDAWSDPAHLRDNMVTGLPTCLQQGDLLQPLGSLLVARGDTFVVRAYGEMRADDGITIVARAWCEAEVQRIPDYVEAQDPPQTPPTAADGKPNQDLSKTNRKYGRRFQILSFRWLTRDEV